MTLYIAGDHRGFRLKEELIAYLREEGYALEDLGNERYDVDDDYPDFAGRVARRVSEFPEENRGIVICGSGVGVDIVANKLPRVRSVLAFALEQVRLSRNDDDTNVIALPADYLRADQAKEFVALWLTTPFSGSERHKRRLKKISQIDQ